MYIKMIHQDQADFEIFYWRLLLQIIILHCVLFCKKSTVEINKIIILDEF